jgi:hypothetical protein
VGCQESLAHSVNIESNTCIAQSAVCRLRRIASHRVSRSYSNVRIFNTVREFSGQTHSLPARMGELHADEQRKQPHQHHAIDRSE